jgi:uncharacterized protein (DUF608 family)
MKKATTYPQAVLKGEKGQRVFTAEHLLQIAMPLGGIGAGCVCLNGYGGLQDFSIRHKPQRTALPDRRRRKDAAFALLRIKGNDVTRLVEGPFPPEKIFAQGLNSQGHLGGGHEGFPRFRKCAFKGEYPFGVVTLADPDVPLQARITGFNPFIPLDLKNSALPCAILEYELENTSSERVAYEFSFHLSHLAPGADAGGSTKSRNERMPGLGVFFSNEEHPLAAEFGSAALAVVGHEPLVKAMWFRGGWFDSMSALWREVSSGTFQPNDGRNEAGLKGRNGGSVLLQGSLEPGDRIIYPIVITWYFPNVHFAVGGLPAEDSEPCCGESLSDEAPKAPAWRPYYVSHWADARDVAQYIVQNYAALRARTQAFHDALFQSTLPAYVLDAVSANLAIIKSPTVLLQENGNMWAWEGCFPDLGCCPGSCTHVWNYAQSIPHLYPQLERTLREQELERSMDEHGHVTFRSALPDGPTPHKFHAAADGQLGGIMKLYREWQISGDQDWLSKMYPLAKTSMDYCIRTWDPRRKGVLEEPHHNTYDIEFWGPDGMCTSFYLGALAAMAALARDSGHLEDAPFYEDLAQNGAEYIDTHLFNGEFYEQKVTTENLLDTSFQALIAGVTEDSPFEGRLLKIEGPKYQYGSGCISDGVMGAWLAGVCWVDSPQNRSNIRRNLKSIFEYNFQESLWHHANPQRPGYALGDEPGLLLCTWPKGGKPTLPFVYSDEVWTGIEYQVACHLITEGFVDEGLTIVKALRKRYDGHARNPWDEYECGSYYARAMVSYDLLRALSGFHYSATRKTLRLHPKLSPTDLEVFFATAKGWGTLGLSGGALTVDLREGEMEINTLQIVLDGEERTLRPGVVARAGAKTHIDLNP